MSAVRGPLRTDALQVATMAQRMAENSEGDGRAFRMVAMISIGAIAAASALQLLTPLLRELNRKHDAEQTRGRSR